MQAVSGREQKHQAVMHIFLELLNLVAIHSTSQDVSTSALVTCLASVNVLPAQSLQSLVIAGQKGLLTVAVFHASQEA